MSSQLVSVKWDGHHKTLVSILKKLLVNSHFVDCTIAAEGQKMKAHKEVLSAFSPYFELLLGEDTENNPTVIISGISFRDLRSLVDFMYQGKLEVTEDRIEDLIDAAECLQIKGLGGGGCKEDGLGNTNNTTVLPKRPALSSGIPHKRARKGKSEETAKVFCKESGVNNLKYSNEIQSEKSPVITCGARQTSPIRTPMCNSDKSNISSVSNLPLMPSKESTLSEVQMDSLHLLGESVVKKEPDSDGDDNISEPMKDTRKAVHVRGSSGNSYKNSGEEIILGLSSDISVPSENNAYERLPSDCVPPAVLSSKKCSSDSIVSSVQNELRNISENLSSVSVDPEVSAAQTGGPLFHSEFDMKSEDESLLSVDDDLISEKDGFSENSSESIGDPPGSGMRMKVVSTDKVNDFSGAVSRCIEESAYSPPELAAVFVKTESIECYGPEEGLMPGLPAEDEPQDAPTHPLQMTSGCERYLSGPSGRDGSSAGSLTDEQYRCQFCSKTFTHNRDLKVHMQIHTGDRPFQYECNYAAVTSIKSNEHQHIQSGKKLHKCVLCDFKTVHRSALSVHKRIHNGLKPYKCPECDYTSAYSNHLKRHQRTHSGLKPYKCPECDYTATQTSNLKRHQGIHSGVKPYKCTECDYAALQSTALKLHQRTHSGFKPYKCTECDYKSAYNHDLKTHIRVHHR